MDTNYLMLVIMIIIEAIAFGLGGFLKTWIESKQQWDWAKFVSTIIYSLVVAVIIIQSGLVDLTKVTDWSAILNPVWMQYMTIYTLIYAGAMYFFTKIVVPVAQKLSSKTVFYTTKYAMMGFRKMDPESRQFLIFDLPEWAKQSTLNCVDQAEATTPMQFQYAIQSASWIFLIENGELTGAKHYWFRGWFGAAVCWKPITAATLQKCRDTGFIPEYTDLS